jgi:hypothetical protein
MVTAPTLYWLTRSDFEDLELEELTLWPANLNARDFSEKFQIITMPSAPPDASCLPL